MNASFLILGTYFIIKYSAYSFWSFRGLLRFQSERKSLVGPALGLGALRSTLGLGFGILIWLGASFVVEMVSASTAGQVLAYLFVYVPVRWVEWSVILLVILVPARSLKGFIVGISREERMWRLGGIAISCVADIPLIVAIEGLPIGRFMC